jgi:hypothetical protein
MAGLVGASTLWLTFFPSRAYRRYIEGHRATPPSHTKS